MNKLLPMHQSKRCGAHSRRSGKPCRNGAMKNGRCRMHGGKSTGAPKGNRNAWKHGNYFRLVENARHCIPFIRIKPVFFRAGQRCASDLPGPNFQTDQGDESYAPYSRRFDPSVRIRRLIEKIHADIQASHRSEGRAVESRCKGGPSRRQALEGGDVQDLAQKAWRRRLSRIHDLRSPPAGCRR
jgi:hypothetical protein